MPDMVNREELLMELYKSAFPPVAKYIGKQGGSFDDAKDVFQDALVIYYEKTMAGNLIPENNKAYLSGIAKHLWFKKFRENNFTQPLDALSPGADFSDETEEQISSGKLLGYLEKAGKRCLEILSAFYYHQVPMKDLAEALGYSGERSVTVQKYKCLEKVRETVKEQSLAYADFVE